MAAAFLTSGCSDGATESEIGVRLERRSDSFLDDYLASRGDGGQAPALPVDGDWYGIAFCPSGPYPVSLQVSGMAGSGSILPAIGDPRRTTPFYRDHIDRPGTVSYTPNAQTLVFDAAPGPEADSRQARGLLVQLLLAPGAQGSALLRVAETSQGRPRTCADGIAGRGAAAAELRAFAERLGTLRGDRRAVEQQSCPAEYAAWLDAAVGRGPEALVLPSFATAFGGAVFEVPAERLLAASAVMMGSCNQAGDARDRIARTRAATLLRDYKAYQSVWLTAHRDRVAEHWRAWADQRLADGAVTERQTAVAMRRAPADFSLTAHPALAGFDAIIAARNDELQADQQNLTFVRRIEDQRDDFRELLNIAMQARSRGDVDMNLVAQGLDYYLADAADSYAGTVTEPRDAAYLAAWAGQQRTGSCPAADPDTCKHAVEAIDDHLQDLAEDYADTEDDAFDALMDRALGLDRLAAMVAFEHDLRQRYGALADHDAFADGVERRQHRRRDAQQDMADQLLERLTVASTAPAMRAVADDHFLDDDLAMLPELQSALDDVLATTRPFAGLPAGNYLNALYNRDFDRLRTLDSHYLAGIRPLMHAIVGQFGELGALVDAITGKRPGTSQQDLQRGLVNLSALHAALGTYLVDYQDVYDACLQPGARTFTITRRTDIVTVDGFGTEIGRREGWTSRDSYRINAQFAGHFQALFDTATGSAQAQLFDMFLNDARVTTLRNGVRRLMASHDCDSAEVKQFEQGLLAYDAELKRRARRR